MAIVIFNAGIRKKALSTRTILWDFSAILRFHDARLFFFVYILQNYILVVAHQVTKLNRFNLYNYFNGLKLFFIFNRIQIFSTLCTHVILNIRRSTRILNVSSSFLVLWTNFWWRLVTWKKIEIYIKF